MGRVQQPLKIHGGKGAFNGKLAQWIISLIPEEHTHFGDVFFGGGSVTMHKDPDGISEFANDLDGELTNFWQCLQDRKKFREMERLLSVTPLSEAAWNKSQGLFKTPVERAVNLFIRCRQSRQGLQKDYCTPTKRTRRGMNEQVSAWLSAVDGLREVRDRLIRIEILNKPAIEVILERDHADCVFYCDPPYLASTRSSGGEYRQFEMSENEHRELLGVLSRIEGKFLLSGYRSELYDSHAEMAGWQRHEFKIPNNAASGVKKKEKVECVWTNFH